MSSGASTPPGRAGAERDGPDHRLRDGQPQQEAADEVAVEEIADGVVPHAEGAGKDQAAQADEQSADDRPPHVMDRQLGEEILEGIHQPREPSRREAGGDPDGERERQLLPGERRVRRDREDRPGAQEGHSDRSGDRGGRGDRNEAPRLPLEQQQLDREQHRGERRREDGRHAPRPPRPPAASSARRPTDETPARRASRARRRS